MPPKVKITKEEIIRTAVDLVRKGEAINARTLAATLNCSTQPIFSNFATMEQLTQAVLEQAKTLYEEYTRREIESGQYPDYKASGMAYIRFAREEKEFFKLLFMCDRCGEDISEYDELNGRMESYVQQNTGLTGMDVKLFHLEVWAFVHGIATMFATGFLDLPWDLVSKMLTDAFQGLRKQYESEGSHGSHSN